MYLVAPGYKYGLIQFSKVIPDNTKHELLPLGEAMLINLGRPALCAQKCLILNIFFFILSSHRHTYHPPTTE